MAANLPKRATLPTSMELPRPRVFIVRRLESDFANLAKFPSGTIFPIFRAYCTRFHLWVLFGLKLAGENQVSIKYESTLFYRHFDPLLYVRSLTNAREN